jgi:2,5-diketo-D-gluconate reductase B
MRILRVQEAEIPALGFGTWMLHGQCCQGAVEAALAIGYRHIDTAQAYGNEREVGEAIAASGVAREHIWVTTKLPPGRLDAETVPVSVDRSLRDLRVDYLDLLLIHWPDPSVALEETLGAMRKLQEQGVVRHLGVSNFPIPLLDQALRLAPILCNQVEYHPFLSQSRLLKRAQEADFALVAYSPLARGKVSGNAVLRRIGHQHGKTASQVALRWLLQQDKVAPIPKAASVAHIEENYAIFDFELSPSECAAIHALANATHGLTAGRDELRD